jgi:hypothetical protein
VTASLVARDGSHRESNRRSSHRDSSEGRDSLRNSMGQSHMGLMLAQRAAMLEVGGNTSTIRPTPPGETSSLTDPSMPISSVETMTSRTRALAKAKPRGGAGADVGPLGRDERRGGGAASSALVSISDRSDYHSSNSDVRAEARAGRITARDERADLRAPAPPSISSLERALAHHDPAGKRAERPRERDDQDIFM